MSYLKIQENPSGDFRSMYRHPCKGAWMLADRDHGWPVSDCTAEALKVLYCCTQKSRKKNVCLSCNYMDLHVPNNSMLSFLIQALLLLSEMPTDVVGEKIEVKRLYEAVDFILNLQVLKLNI